MSAPVRVQLRRVKGWKMPPNTVRVARGSRWGNPYKIGADNSYHGGPDNTKSSRQQCVDLYRDNLETVCEVEGIAPYDYLADLRGKNLACWCPLEQPCHADVLLELANR